MTKLNKIFLILIVVLVIILLTIIFYQRERAPVYHAVFLETGELYFGQLSRFPSFKLRDVYFLQRHPDDPENPFSIQKLEGLFYSPEDKLVLNSAKVVWVVRLKPESSVVRFIREQRDVSLPTVAPEPLNVPAPVNEQE